MIYRALLFIAFVMQGSIMPAPFSFIFPKHVDIHPIKKSHYVGASDGVQLAYYDFINPQASHSIIFYHGAGAWSMNLYQYMAQQISQKYPVNVYLFDIRGHGNSGGPRGDASSKDQVFHDVSTSIDFVHQSNPHLPIVLGGHSSGAGLVLNYSGWHKHPHVKGYLLEAPFLGNQSGALYEHSDPERHFIKRIRLFFLIINALTGGYFFDNTHVIFFNYPDEERNKDHNLLESYTCSMTCATTPYNSKDLFKEIDKPFMLLAAGKDEQFIPSKILEHADYAEHVKKKSRAMCLEESTHLSIVYDSVDTVGQWIINL